MTEKEIAEARRLRAKYGWSFIRLGKKFGVHQTTVYYALNPRKRSREIASGRQRSLYLDEQTWANLERLASHASLTRSRMVVALISERIEVLDRSRPLFEAES